MEDQIGWNLDYEEAQEIHRRLAMMSLEEMEKAQKDFEARKLQRQRPMFQTTVKDELRQVNWRLVIAISFGFLMWYAGTAILEELFK